MSKDSKEEIETPLGILTYSEKENCLHHNPLLNSRDWNKVEVWLFKTVSDLQSSEKDKRIKELEELSENLFKLWDSLVECGEISIGGEFRAKYENYKQQLTKNQ